MLEDLPGPDVLLAEEPVSPQLTNANVISATMMASTITATTMITTRFEFFSVDWSGAGVGGALVTCLHKTLAIVLTLRGNLFGRSVPRYIAIGWTCVGNVVWRLGGAVRSGRNRRRSWCNWRVVLGWRTQIRAEKSSHGQQSAYLAINRTDQTHGSGQGDQTKTDRDSRQGHVGVRANT